jgi:uncharacterized membrane protein
MTSSFRRKSLNKNKFNLYKKQLCLVAVTFFLGLFFRLHDLDNKIFWVDEVATALRTAGYTTKEVTQKVSDASRQGYRQRPVVEIEELQNYQKLTPQKDWNDTFSALKQSPEHSPLYFVLARVWRQWFGSSIFALRIFSIFLGLLAFPCLYWLCLELFKSPSVGAMAIALFSVSPFYIAYAQEARPYSLWTVTILLSHATFLRAIRLNQTRNWLFYTGATLLGFYTSLLSFLVTFGQGVYLIFLEKSSRQQVIKKYLISSLIAGFCFFPWIVIILQNYFNFQDNTTWMRNPVEPSFLAAIWVATILVIFGDFPLPDSIEILKVIGILIILAIALTIGLIARFVIKSNRVKKISNFLKRLVLFLGIILAIAFLGLKILSSHSARENLAIAGIFIAVGILYISIFSLFYVVNTTSKSIKLFLLTQTFTAPLLLLINDAIAQDQIAGAPRYLIPLQLGIMLAVAYTLADRIESLKARQQIWKAIAVILISVGVISGILNLEKSPNYQKSRNIHNPAIATILNQSKNPLLLVDSPQTIDILSLSQNLEKKVKTAILSKPEYFAQYAERCQEIFLFNPPEQLRAYLQTRDRLFLEQVYQPKSLIPGETVLSLWSIKKEKNRCAAIN